MSLSHIRLPPCSRLPAGRGVCEYVRARVRSLVSGLPRERAGTRGAAWHVYARFPRLMKAIVLEAILRMDE